MRGFLNLNGWDIVRGVMFLRFIPASPPLPPPLPNSTHCKGGANRGQAYMGQKAAHGSEGVCFRTRPSPITQSKYKMAKTKIEKRESERREME